MTPEAPGRLPALRRVSPRIWTGGLPEGPEAFRELAALGIQTIVDVDGAPPDVEAAAAAGLKSIHVPIGYDGITDSARAALTRVAAESQDVLYVHCHHGKHRGPAAAAVCGLAANEIDRLQAVRVLKEAGTNPDYRGLWEAVESFRPAPRADWPELTSRVEPPEFVEQMIRIDHAFDEVTQIAVGASNKDPAAESLLLWDGLREAHRLRNDRGADFDDALRDAEAAAEKLYAAAMSAERQSFEEQAAAMKTRCAACHTTFRDNRTSR